jgi:hypothetical protein
MMDSVEEPPSTEERELVFHYFPDLHEDIARHILSFVAVAPLERSTPRGDENENDQASLTHILPFVNKMFREFSSSDFFWQPCLLRQLNREDSRRHHWQMGLRRLLPIDFSADKDTDLLDAVLNHVDEMSYKDLYKKIMNSHIRCDYPIFVMPCQLQLGKVYGLHLFEPRYRIMVRELVESCGNPEEACQGETIEPGVKDGVLQPPLLVHACLGTRLGPGELACLVQLVYCRTYEYGTADVQLLPLAWVRLDKLWVRPSSGHLFYTRATRV